MNDLIQVDDVKHVLKVLGRQSRRTPIIRMPDAYTEAIAVHELLGFLLWIDYNPKNESMAIRLRSYLELHMRPEDYEHGAPVDRSGLIRTIAEQAEAKINQSMESDWPGILSDALAEIVNLSQYHE